MFNNENLKKQAVVSFQSSKKKDIDSKKDKPNSELSSKDLMQNKVLTARMYANKEIKKYRELVENFIFGLEDLCLFKPVEVTAQAIFIEQILEDIIEPILKGFKPIGMSEELYRAMRADMYKTLINKYIDDIGND